MTEKQMALAAAEFAERWKGRGYERGESQPFWIDLLSNVFGIETPSDGFIRFEDHRMVDASNFIDGRIPSTRVLIEQKSLGKDLRTPVRQSDGSLLNPFQQARRYVVSLPVSEHPRWIVTCNFSEFLVYDMEQPNGEPEQILLDNLGKEYYRLMFLVDEKNEHLSKEMQVSMQAGEIVGKIYEALLKQYDDNSSEALRWLNILCVRIVFCLYAEDAGVFSHDQFHDYLVRYDAEDLRSALIRLFEVLNTPADKRSKYLKDDLKAFPYTNGGLFEEEIEIPQFTEELKQTLLQNASLDFDWSEISPTIFGAVFESTLNPETRRSGGMHYTSIANIHKVIDPLFLSDLRRELDEILEEKVERQRQKKLDAYQDRLASLTFLDPACGSGNFLTETYLSLRRLENEVIRERHHGQSFLGFEEVNPIKVSIQQFYGIEINDFAVTVATTALWISEAQMLRETEKIIRRDIDFLPLKSYHNIREGNALRMNWLGGDVAHVAQREYSYECSNTSHVAQRECNNEFSDVSHVASLQFMERDKYIRITGKKLPHWHQQGKVQFVTFRLADSLPQERLKELSDYKEQWMASHPQPWDLQTENEYNHAIRSKIDKWLDNNYGSCLLANENIRQIVIDCLLFHHGKDYWLHHFVIMPNHVHLLLSPIGEHTVEEAIGNVKRFTAHAINSSLGRKGEVWQRMVFDRMVRDQQNYEDYVNYINNNPLHLPPGTYSLGGDVAHVAQRGMQQAGNITLAATNSFSDVGHVASYSYIIGNPPFVGARQMNESQKEDVINIFGEKWKNVGNLDYVCCWYMKAFQTARNSHTRVAFVSTNSICQGEQVANLWQPLMENGLRIDFAHRTFRWDSEASLKAHVHCVIVGFSVGGDVAHVATTNGADSDVRPRRLLFDNDKIVKASHINAYLMDAPDVFVGSRQRPICDVPSIGIGNKPIDGGNYLFTKEQMEEFVKLEPKATQYFKPWYGAEEFIHQKPRYCLWLGDCSPAELRQMPHCMKRIEAVREMRLASSSAGTRKLAERPTRFHVENMPNTTYILVPRHSSENRRYIPMGFLTPEIFASDAVQIIPDATLYHFGILESNVHMAWMRVVCGRLK
ncbi:MAG: transposase, partial [Prevotella sp.]|nr:transposase [Prevotella sp.]